MSHCRTLELPLPPFQFVAGDARRSSSGRGKRRCDTPLRARVLFICDDDAVRDATLQLLRAFGYDAAALSSAEALAQARGYTHLDLIIADHCLDSTDGLDVISRLRATDGTRWKALLLTYDPWLPATLSGRAADIWVVERPLSGHGLLSVLHGLIGEPI